MNLPQNCPVEISTAPLLTTCPPDNSYFLLFNQSNPQTISLIAYNTLRQCIFNNLVFGFLQFTVGDVGSPMLQGETVLVISNISPIQDSVSVVLGGVVLDRNDPNQISYQVAYTFDTITITWNQGVQDGQTYLIFYAYST